jgi:hypothetical protein
MDAEPGKDLDGVKGLLVKVHVLNNVIMGVVSII